MKSWLLLLLLTSFPLFAQTEIKKETTIKHSSVKAGYQVISSWLPFQWSLSYAYNFNPKWSLEAEWSRGHYGVGAFGFDVATVTESRYSLFARKFVGKSFHLIFGGYKYDFHAELDEKLLDQTNNEGIDDFRVQAFGLALGIGNRWIWNNGFTFGIDWFRMNVPLFDKKVENQVLDDVDDNNDLSRVKAAIYKVKNVPTFVLFGINLGYSF